MKAFVLRVLAVVAAVGLGASASAAEPVNVTIALIPSESAAEAYYAQDLGYFKAAGLNVTLIPFPASPPIIAAVSSGAADIGNSVVGSVVAARSRGVNVKFLQPLGCISQRRRPRGWSACAARRCIRAPTSRAKRSRSPGSPT